MKHLTKLSWLLMALALLALPACGGGAPAVPTVDTFPLFTQVAGTAVALQTQIAQVAMTETSIAALPTAVPATSTPQPTNTPLPTNTLAPTSTSTPKPVVVYPTPNGTQSANTGPVPTMDVTLLVNDMETNTASIYAGKPLILRARVENTSTIPMQVTANLTVPDGWDVDQDAFSDCPTDDSFDLHEVCTISWYFTPQVSGQLTLRVYVRGHYTDISGNSQRITDSPAFIFAVQPAKS
jgi:hypothetical protein